MGRAETFTNLGEQFLSSFDDRMKFIRHNIDHTKQLLSHFRSEQKKMGNQLRKSLANFTHNLTEEVGHFLTKEHSENKRAHQAFMRVAHEMARKRRTQNPFKKNGKHR